jgi:hypothetical protein
MSWTIDGLVYQKRKRITISKTNVSATLTAFPLCVQIVSDANIGAVCKSDMTDLRFTNSTGTLLYSERESGAVAAGAASGIFWVNVTSISTSADTDIYCYYGNAGASAQATPAFVWDANYGAVYHLNQTGTNPQILDSKNANHSAAQIWTPTASQIIGNGSVMDGSTGYANIGHDSSINIAGALTISLWMKTVETTYKFIVGGYNTGTGNAGYGLMKTGITAHKLSAWMGGASWVTGGTSIDDGNWYRVNVVTSGTNCKIYVNGQQDGDGTITGLGAYTGDKFLGKYTGTGYNYGGALDEVSISNIARPVAWLKFEYFNQKDAAGQLTFQAQEISPAGGNFFQFFQ